MFLGQIGVKLYYLSECTNISVTRVDDEKFSVLLSITLLVIKIPTSKLKYQLLICSHHIPSRTMKKFDTLSDLYYVHTEVATCALEWINCLFLLLAEE